MTTLDDLSMPVDLGWRIFPVYGITNGRCRCGDIDCHSAGKHPMIKRWPQQATADPMAVYKWFKRLPGCNWAVATGHTSGIWVLDIDVHQDDGLASIKDWLDANGITMPQTYVVSTGGGGRHFYFKADRRVKNRSGVLPGVDVRASGGYVLLPGSNHISGGTYVAASRTTEIRRAPEKLITFLQTAGSASTPRGSGTARGISTALDRYLTKGFTPGDRDNECYRLACSLWRKHWNDPEFVEAAIADCWRVTEQGDAPFPWSQAKRKIAEAYKFVKSSKEVEDTFLRQHGGVA